MNYRVKVQFFSPDHIPTAKGEFTIESDTVPNAILKEIECLKERGYHQNEFVVTYIGSQE